MVMIFSLFFLLFIFVSLLQAHAMVNVDYLFMYVFCN